MDTEQKVARIAPLVDELGVFCGGHDESDGRLAAARMLVRVRNLWPDVPQRQISHDPDPEEDLEVLALRIVRDVGNIADRLLSNDVEEALGWSRANLIFDLERYLETIGRR